MTMSQRKQSGLKIVPCYRQRIRGAVAPAPLKPGPAHEKEAQTNGISEAGTVTKRTKYQLIGAAFNWSLCLLLMFLLLSQFITIAFSTFSMPKSLLFGRRPSLGTHAISGHNDEPYSDRMLVCHRRGRRFDVMSVNEVLRDPTTVVEDMSGLSKHGYRVVNRTGMVVSDTTKLLYSKTCSLINDTLDRIFSICTDLGYLNVTHDSLRIVDDVDSNRLHHIRSALPVLIMPFWDNGPTSRYAIPGWDGHACMFRLGGLYEVAGSQSAYLIASNRSVREDKTVEWLGRPGGDWKNGWYEDPEGMKWYSDALSTNSFNTDGISSWRFDMIDIQAIDCMNADSSCTLPDIENRWGNLQLTARSEWFTSVAISNGNRYGVFIFESFGHNIATCGYDFASFTLDMTFAWLLVQWMLRMIVVQRGFFKHASAWHNTDIGCLANTYSFGMLTISTLPRAKMIIAAFCSVGCAFEGDQKALSDAWFIVYPAIVDMVLVHSSVVNILAKIFRRRMISWQIPVMITLLSLMHYLRVQIATSNWFGYDGRVSTLVSSKEFDAMSLFELILPRTTLRLTGNVKALFLMKALALCLNTLPLVFSQDMSLHSKRSVAHSSCASEISLGVRVCNVGGLGRSDLYDEDNSSTVPRRMLNSYELVRLGYIIVGNTYLMTWESWIRLAAISSLSRVNRWKNHRLMVFEVIGNVDKTFSISTHPQLINLSDPKLLSLKWWDIDSRSLH